MDTEEAIKNLARLQHQMDLEQVTKTLKALGIEWEGELYEKQHFSAPLKAWKKLVSKIEKEAR